MTARHANAPDYVMREGERRFPLDLAGRVAWLREQADACVSEPDRHELERRIRLLRNGVAEPARPRGFDFHVQRHPATGDASLFPSSERAREHVRAVRRLFGDEALVGMSLYVETSRSEDYLADTISDLREQGFTIREEDR